MKDLRNKIIDAIHNEVTQSDLDINIGEIVYLVDNTILPCYQALITPKVEAYDQILKLLYPDGAVDHEWDASTIEQVALIMNNSQSVIGLDHD